MTLLNTTSAVQTMRLALLFLCSSGIGAFHVPYGFQSGPDISNSFAGGMVYDPDEHLLYITGATYGNFFTGYTSAISIGHQNPVASDCFLSVFKLSDDNKGSPELMETGRWGNTSVLEACSSLTLGSAAAFVVGHTEEGGLMTRFKADNDDVRDATVYGTVAHFGVNIIKTGNSEASAVSTYLNGGRLVSPTHGVHYPVATVTDKNNALYVATMTTTKDSPRFTEKAGMDDKVDLTTGGEFKYGSGFKLSLEKLLPMVEVTEGNDEIKETLGAEWTLNAAPTNGEDVYLSSMVYVDYYNVLLFAGSTKGYGPEFGATSRSVNDFDGFVTKVDPEFGVIPVRLDEPDGSYSTRIESLPYQDDFVNGLCHYGSDVYVVGTTHGRSEPEFPDMASSGSTSFLIKLRLETLDVVWKKQIGGIPESSHGDPARVRGIACAVTPDGEDVYLAGTVYNGASLDIAGVASYGGDDVFVAQLDADTGNVNYAVQIGTYQDEWLAHGGGITVDAQGHAILLGNTRGALIRDKDDTNVDVFFLSVSRETGEHTDIVVPTASQSSSDDGGVGTGVILLSVFGSVALVFGFLVFLHSAMRRREQRKQENTQNVFLETVVEDMSEGTTSIV